MNISDLPEYATAREISRVLRCSSKYVQTQMATGQLRSAKIANRYLATQQDIAEFIERKVVSCPSATEAHSSDGEKTGNSGSSSGTPMAPSGASQR